MLRHTLIKRVCVVIAIFWMFAPSILILSSTALTEAQDDAHNFASLLRTLNNQIVEQAGGQLTLSFVSPVEGILKKLDIPSDKVDGIPRISITDIGDDFMCYRDNTGEVFFVYCVPFSNIASVSYTEVP